MSPLVDFHCHIDLLPDPQRAFSAVSSTGVEILSVTTTPLAWPRNCEMAEGVRNVRVGLGLHPQLIGEKVADISAFERFAPKAHYIGEIGLDAGPRHYRAFPEQLRLFQRVLEVCSDSGSKILSIHSIRSGRQVLDLLERFFPPSAGTAILHWFTGSVFETRRAVSFGCYFSINPRMAQSKGGQAVLREIPPNRLLTESDAPFAEATRPERNHPGDVQRALDWIGREKKLLPGEARELVADNLRIIENSILIR